MRPGRPAAATEPACRLAAAALLWLATAIAAQAEPIVLVSKPILLNEQDPALAAVGALRYRGGIEISSEHPGFGGLSGLRVSVDGSTLYAVSDRGRFLTAHLTYAADGTLSAAVDADLSPLPGRGSRRESDAEALTEDGAGGWIVAYEQRHRLMRIPPNNGPPSDIAAPTNLASLPANSGIEAAARLPDGRLLIFAEQSEAGGLHRGWLRGPAGWQDLFYKPAVNFVPTDAVSLDSGDVLVVERAFNLLGGWGARVVQVEAASMTAGSVLRGRELALLRPPFNIDNMEGIAARPADGGVRLYLLSDDNLNFLQRTLLLTFDWRPDPP